MDERPCDMSLRVRLPMSAWRQFRDRAALRKSRLSEYAEMVFLYLLMERLPARPVAGMDDPNEEVYYEVHVSGPTRRRLAERSAAERCNVAAFSGMLIGTFLTKHERDPRDLAMIHYFRSRLDEVRVLSESELRDGIARCERLEGVRLPPGYFTKWLHSRLQPLVQTVLRDGRPVALTADLIAEILAGES